MHLLLLKILLYMSSLKSSSSWKGEKLCSHNIDYYGWLEKFIFDYDKLHWKSTINDYILSFSDDTNVTHLNFTTWTIQDRFTNIITTCHDSEPIPSFLNLSYYDINFADIDPSQCEYWVNNDDLYFQNSEEVDMYYCHTIDTNLENFIFEICFVSLCLLIIISLIFPCRDHHGRQCHKLCDNKEYDAVEEKMYVNILLYQGIDANKKATKHSSKSIGALLLQYDLAIRKIVWYNEIWKDFFLFIRLNHPFFAIIYGHKLHLYSSKKRLITFFIIQSISLALAVDSIVIKDNGLTSWRQILTSILITALHTFLREVMMCEWCKFKLRRHRYLFCDYSEKFVGLVCARSIIFIVFLAVILGIVVVVMWIKDIENYFPETNQINFIMICLIDQWTSIFFSWFVIYSFIIGVYFYNEWHQQNGIKTNKCITILGVLIYRSEKCFISWMFCCCCVYYCKLYQKTQKIKYRKDKIYNKYMIGNRSGEFAITWYEYKQYTNSIAKKLNNYADKEKNIMFERSIYSDTPKRDILSSIKIAHVLDLDIELKIHGHKKSHELDCENNINENMNKNEIVMKRDINSNLTSDSNDQDDFDTGEFEQVQSQSPYASNNMISHDTIEMKEQTQFQLQQIDTHDEIASHQVL